MKKWFSLILAAVMLMGIFGCSAAPQESDPAQQPQESQGFQPETVGEALFDGKTLKVLAIGNSFSNDTTEYLYDVAQAEGVTEIILGRLYYGGCSLERHVNNSRTGKNEYTYYKNTTGKWEQTDNATLLQGLQDEDWDIITMQQSSGNSGLPDTYDYAAELVAFVNANKTNPDAKLVWHMTWAYQKDSTHADFAKYDNDQQKMYTRITEAVQQKILPMNSFVAVIPAGTAVQNARTSFFGDTMTRDGFHLQTLGKLIASYTWYATFTGKQLSEVKLEKTLSAIALSDGMKAVILDSVNSALKTPYSVTPSAYAQWG